MFALAVILQVSVCIMTSFYNGETLTYDVVTMLTTALSIYLYLVAIVLFIKNINK